MALDDASRMAAAQLLADRYAKGGEAANQYEYHPPADWEDISNPDDGAINFLFYDSGIILIHVFCTSAFTIDWGDGTIDEVSLVDYDYRIECGYGYVMHEYVKGSGKPCSRGYTTFKAVVKPIDGEIRSFEFNRTYDLPFEFGYNYYYFIYDSVVPVLGCYCGTDSLTYASGLFEGVCPLLEFFKCDKPLVNVVTVAYMFNRCESLQYVDVNMPNAVDADTMLYGCISMKYIKIVSLASVTIASYILSSCCVLERIDGFNFPSATRLDYALYQDYALCEINNINLPLIENGYSMCEDCYCLKSFDTSSFTGTLQEAYQMFSWCHSLSNIDTSVFDAVPSKDDIFYSSPLIVYGA